MGKDVKRIKTKRRDAKRKKKRMVIEGYRLYIPQEDENDIPS